VRKVFSCDGWSKEIFPLITQPEDPKERDIPME